MSQESGFWIAPDRPILEKNDDAITTCRHDVNVDMTSIFMMFLFFSCQV